MLIKPVKFIIKLRRSVGRILIYGGERPVRGGIGKQPGPEAKQISVCHQEKQKTLCSEGKQIPLCSEEYLDRLMKSQFRLSFKLFMVFVGILMGLPVLNYVFPEIMNFRISGFTVTWLLLGVLIYPVTWVISWVYVRNSIALEEKALTWMKTGDGEREGGACDCSRKSR